MILGRGEDLPAAGVVAAAIYGAAEFMIWSISRNPVKAKAEFGHYLGDDPEFLIDLTELPTGSLRPADPEVFSLIVNATPLGMTGHPPLDLPWGGFMANAVAYDIVTSPVDTAFLQQARAQGLATIDGLAMLIGLVVTMKVYWVALLIAPKNVKL